MSRQINADPSYLTVSSPVVTAYPFTAIAWFLPNTISTNHQLFSISDTAAFVNYFGMGYFSTNVLQGFANAGSGQQNADTTNAANLNEWNMAAIVFLSATNRRVILNADFANEGSSTTNTTPAGLDNTSIGALVGSSVTASNIDYLTAHVAVWDVALTDDEVTALNRGAFPHEVRPSSLLAHWPLWGNHDPEIVFGPKAADGFQMSLVSAPAKGNHRAFKLWTPRRQFIPTPEALFWNVSADQKAHYRLNDDAANTTVEDSSGTSNTGTLEGGDNTSTLSQDPGKISKSFLFNGTDDRVNIDTLVGDVSSDTAGTIAAWLKPTATLQLGQIFSFGDTDANEIVQFRMNADGKIRASVAVAGVNQWIAITDAAAVSAGTYTHVMVVHNGTTATIYIDNVAVAQTLTGSTQTSWIAAATGIDNARIGSGNLDNLGDVSFIKAELDDVRYINRALTAVERTAIFNNGNGTEAQSGTFIPTWNVSADQKGHYTLNDDDPNTIVTDSSGNSNTGALEGGDNTADISQDPGKISKALLFNGTDDRVNIDTLVGDVSANTTGSITAWVKATAALQTGQIVSFGDTNANEILQFRMNSDGILRASVTVASTTQWILVTDAAALVAATYVHCMVIHNGTQATLYVNNVAVAQTFTTDISRTQWLSSMTGVDTARIGSANFNSSGDLSFIKAELDDVRYINRALTELERATIFNDGNGTESSSNILTPDWDVSASQKAHYKLNDVGNDTTVTDSSGTSNDGTLEGGDNTSTLSQDPGKISKSLLFNGIDDCVNINAIINDLASTTKGTWAIWVKPVDVTSDFERFISFGDANANERIELQIDPTDGKIRCFNVDAGTTQWQFSTDDVVIFNDTWTHVMLVHDGTSPVLYVNNVLVNITFLISTTLSSWISNLTGLDQARIGCGNFNNNGNTGFFNGQFDDVRIFNRVLTDVERTAIFNNGNGTELDSGYL